jgi:hypothetical protein
MRGWGCKNINILCRAAACCGSKQRLEVGFGRRFEGIPEGFTGKVIRDAITPQYKRAKRDDFVERIWNNFFCILCI